MRRTKEEAAETRQTILAAAERLFVQKGVANVSLELIAESLGLSRGAVRWHFQNKRGLLLALLENKGMPLHELVEYLEIDQKLDPLDELINLAARSFGTLQSDPKRQRLTKQLLNFADSEAPQQRREFDTKLRATIRRVFELAARRHSLAPEWNPDKAALAFHAMIGGLLSEWLRGADFDLSTDAISTLRAFACSLRTKKRARGR